MLAGTPAAQAGLKEGDTIVAVDGQPVRSSHDLTDRLDRLPSQAAIHLEVVRGRGSARERLTIELRTCSRPDTGEQAARFPTRHLPVSPESSRPAQTGSTWHRSRTEAGIQNCPRSRGSHGCTGAVIRVKDSSNRHHPSTGPPIPPGISGPDGYREQCRFDQGSTSAGSSGSGCGVNPATSPQPSSRTCPAASTRGTQADCASRCCRSPGAT